MADSNKGEFNFDLIKKYPRSNKKVSVFVKPYGLLTESSEEHKSQTTYISPHGLEFQGKVGFSEGTLLKINVSIPNFWDRKRQLVNYGRVDRPGTCKILAKVVHSEVVGKRGRKKKVTVQTVNMDEVDEAVLKTFLQEG